MFSLCLRASDLNRFLPTHPTWSCDTEWGYTVWLSKGRTAVTAFLNSRQAHVLTCSVSSQSSTLGQRPCSSWPFPRAPSSAFSITSGLWLHQVLFSACLLPIEVWGTPKASFHYGHLSSFQSSIIPLKTLWDFMYQFITHCVRQEAHSQIGAR